MNGIQTAFRPLKPNIEVSLLLGIVPRASQHNLLVLEGLLVLHLVLRVSLHCLIYKVHAADRREFYPTTSAPLCQPLFSGTSGKRLAGI